MAYVERLAERLTPLWGDDGGKGSRFNFRSNTTDDTSSDVSGMSPVTTLDEQTPKDTSSEASGMSSVTTLDEQTPRDTSSEASVTTSDEQTPEDTSSEASGMSPATTSDQMASKMALQDCEVSAAAISADATHADQLPGVAGSLGSVGHPELCSRPCLYFAAGKCKSGEACKFCHMPHTRSPAQLDKALRAEVRDLTFQELVALVLPVLKQKVAALDKSGQTMTLFAELASACGVASVAGGDGMGLGRVPARRHRRLLGVFKAMSLRALLATAGPALAQHRPGIEALARQLDQQLRASVSAEAASDSQ